MAEQLKVGSVDCDFMSQAEWLALCQDWLKSSSGHHVVTLNAEMVVLAQTDAIFRAAVQSATVRVPEGGPLWARSYLGSQTISVWKSLLAFVRKPAERITGVDMVWQLAELAVATRKPLYLLGGTITQNEEAAARLKQTLPSLSVFTAAAHDFTMAGPRAILDDIRIKQPAILLVAYGAPKQTVWIEQHLHQLPSVKIAVGVGGALVMISGQLPRAPLIFRQMNMEWLWRLILQPWRFGRIWRAVVIFPQIIRRQKVAQSNI